MNTKLLRFKDSSRGGVRNNSNTIRSCRGLNLLELLHLLYVTRIDDKRILYKFMPFMIKRGYIQNLGLFVALTREKLKAYANAPITACLTNFRGLSFAF